MQFFNETKLIHFSQKTHYFIKFKNKVFKNFVKSFLKEVSRIILKKSMNLFYFNFLQVSLKQTSLYLP